ncbi:MAG: hypothetical protein JO314_10505 [Acidobacteria bacterium]|nr:hypothetical protein [Acidobacteriota bacterium]
MPDGAQFILAFLSRVTPKGYGWTSKKIAIEVRLRDEDTESVLSELHRLGLVERRRILGREQAYYQISQKGARYVYGGLSALWRHGCTTKLEER